MNSVNILSLLEEKLIFDRNTNVNNIISITLIRGVNSVYENILINVIFHSKVE
jgi:hypothetical protein